MTEQDNTPIFDSKEYAKQVSDLVNKIQGRKLTKEQLKDAKKSLADILQEFGITFEEPAPF